MAKTIKLNCDQIGDIVLDDLVESMRDVENAIANLLERASREELPTHLRADLEDHLDIRPHLKAVIKFYSTTQDRLDRNLTF